MFDLVNHTHFPKEDHLPEWARRDNQVKKSDRVEHVDKFSEIAYCQDMWTVHLQNTLTRVTVFFILMVLLPRF